MGSRHHGAAWECAARPCPHGFPNRGPGSRCVAPGGPDDARHAQRRSGRQPPVPSIARRQSQSYRAARWRPCLSPVAHAGQSLGRSSWGPWVRVAYRNPTLPELAAVTACYTTWWDTTYAHVPWITSFLAPERGRRYSLPLAWGLCPGRAPSTLPFSDSYRLAC